jgi:hypothetical protein
MRISVGNGCWVAIDDLGLPGPLYVRFGGTDDTGRLRVTEFYLDASQNRETPIEAGDLRELPLSGIEAVVNAELAEVVRKRADHPAPDLGTLASYFVTTFGNLPREVDNHNWVATSFAAQYNRAVWVGAGFAPVPRVRRKERSTSIREVDAEYRIQEGPVDGLTDDFLSQVARAYAAALARGERPNRTIAQQLNYPLKSVQRWVYTARLRGIMPRGTRGRAG